MKKYLVVNNLHNVIGKIEIINDVNIIMFYDNGLDFNELPLLLMDAEGHKFVDNKDVKEIIESIKNLLFN
jgi:uncharacterized protein YlzI (FlbEa/FlbD family)